VVRHFSPIDSTAYGLGTLFMVLWLPIVGNIIHFLVQRIPMASAPKAFAVGTPFRPHALVEMTLRSGDQSAQFGAGELRCLFVIGTEGFSARVEVEKKPVPDEPTTAQVEFLAPAVALAQLAANGSFSLVQGSAVVGQGRILSSSQA
jgi:hypothetical protein